MALRLKAKYLLTAVIITLAIIAATAGVLLWQFGADVVLADEDARRALTIVGLAVLGVLAACLVIAWYTARRLVQPIGEMIRDAERVGRGDYSGELDLSREDELGELGRALNVMRKELKRTTVSRDYLDRVLASIPDAVVVTSPDGLIKRVNESTTRLLGYRDDELLGNSLRDFVAKDKRSAFSIDRSLTEAGETRFVTKKNDKVPVSYTSSVMSSDDPQFEGLIFVLRNITERKKTERRIRFLARFDPLTRIPNRMQFQHLLQRSIARAKRKNKRLGLLYLDMDRFKDVNDTFGHMAGDRSLEIVSQRLMQALPKETIIGRLAGDEFAIIIEGLTGEKGTKAELGNTARALLNSLGRAFYLQGNEVFLTASIGMGIYPEDGENVIDLIRNADAAMYCAKQNGGNTFEFYSPEMNAESVERLMLKSKLRRALERNEFTVLYQPKVDLRDGTVVGAEALLRWQLPGHGHVPTLQFIALAEESNLILDIGEWVLNRVCEDYKTWQSKVPRPGRVAINLSLKQLRQVQILERIKTIFRDRQLSPTCVEFEITESTLMQDTERTVRILDELYGMGLHLSIDDFGTGYSSLSSLQQFPISTLKVDQSFVQDAAVDSDDATIVKTIIDMGRSLDMDVIAEGVESEEQLNFLRENNCTYAQGHLFGDPMTSDDYLELLVRQNQGLYEHSPLFA